MEAIADGLQVVNSIERYLKTGSMKQAVENFDTKIKLNMDIDTGEFLLESHHAMANKGAMPWVYHDFWLRDMEFTNSHQAGLCKLPQGYNKSKYLFFPGCQLGASEPKYVTESYNLLLKHYPDTGLMLNCCGAPGDWAGAGNIHGKVIEEIKAKWLEVGKPILILACATCKQMLNKHLPEIESVFLYELMEEENINIKGSNYNERAAVFDPCNSRHEAKLQKTIRNISLKAGFTLDPLTYEGKYAKCCSYGGQVSIANPRYAKEVVKSRLAQSQETYIAYCSNCRDIFASSNKESYHILDIIFALHDSNRKAPTFTERRENRIKLKKQVLKKFWNEEIIEETQEGEGNLNLFISPQLKEKLNEDMILESEIKSVIEYCEKEGKKILNSENGHFTGHLKIGNMTYWAEYGINDGDFQLFNAYAHRMSIGED